MGSRWWTGSLQRQHSAVFSRPVNRQGVGRSPIRVRCGADDMQRGGMGAYTETLRGLVLAIRWESLGGSRWGVAGGRPWQRQLKEPGWAWRAWWA